MSRTPLFVLRMTVTFAVALASFVFVEMPIREKRIFRTKGYGSAVVGAIAAIVLVAVLVVPAGPGVSSTVGRDLSRNLPTATAPTPTAALSSGTTTSSRSVSMAGA
jgi:hypothetical protein